MLKRTAMADATTTGGIDADRAGFTTALATARDQIVHAAGILTGIPADLVGHIGRAVLDDPLPPRRVRICPRVVKRAISEHRAKGSIDRTNHRAVIDLNLYPEPTTTRTP
ncbi:hypothetical protein AGRA3207_007457 [Actinomadura graeca]|uniref:Transposase n=1 Tax=Actinomadura graeca TaxID=2750812 RepID=A0ABX8RAR5_9ACTN|nr:hypothetical protein [Actinomadura graeca]QXJ27052.1 hypothetical protein AGRA3207_007457 [Actinomadura graeca]